MNAYVYLAAAMVLVGGGVFIYLWRKDKAEAAPPPRHDPPPPPRKDAPPPPRPKSQAAKSAEQVFRETFPGVRVPPPQFKPFALRAEACQLRDSATGESQPALRFDVGGGVEVTEDLTVDLILTFEDVTEGGAQPVYATQARYQDEQTGQFVLRTTIGKIARPGRPDASWTSVGVVPYANIRAPKSGARTLRISCLAVSSAISGLSVVDARLRGGMLAAATVNFDVSLVRKGYLEQRFARQHAAGLVICLGGAFASRVFRDAARAEPSLRGWMARHLEQMKGEDEAIVAQTRLALEAALTLARDQRADLRVVCRELLAYEVAGMPEAALGLCVEIGRDDERLPADVMVELKALCRELALGLEALQRHAEPGATGAGAEDDEAGAKLLGLELSWDSRRIRRHLLDQFMKWNTRHPRDAAEREQIHRRLEAIAKLRQRYL